MTDHPMPQQCPFCQAQGPFKRHALRETWWRDVPTESRPRVRRGHMVRWRCVTCQQIHTIQPHWAAPPRRMTQELARWIQRQLAQGQPISQIAQASGLDGKTIRSVRQDLESMRHNQQAVSQIACGRFLHASIEST